MVLSLMARRFVENSQAAPRIAAMPSTPVKRPMNTPLQSTESSANQSAHQWPLLSWSFFADVVTLPNEPLRLRKFGVAIVMNCGSGSPLFHSIADPFVEFKPDAVIDLVFLFFTGLRRAWRARFQTARNWYR